MPSPRKGEVGGPDEAHHVPHRKPQVQRDGKAHQVGGQPDPDQIEFVLGEVLPVGLQAGVRPNGGIGRSPENTGLEDVKGREVDEGQDRQVQRRLRREGLQAVSVAELVAPALRREGIDVEEPLEDVDLVQVLESPEVERPEPAKEQGSFVVDVRDRGLPDDDLRHQIGHGRLDRRDGDVVRERVLLCKLTVPEATIRGCLHGLECGIIGR